VDSERAGSREVLDGGNVKGGVLKAHLQWAGENRRGLTTDEIRRRVSPATAAVLGQPILPVSWYPFRAVVETDRAIAAAGAGDAEALFLELGRYSARLNLGTSYKVYARSEPHAFFQLAARLHRQFQDFGRAEYERTGPTSCRLKMSEYPCFSTAFCLSGRGYYEQATALQGGREASVAETDCQCRGGSACRFEIRWT
jgi:uncharacterized protein (TIGR02265 family)